MSALALAVTTAVLVGVPHTGVGAAASPPPSNGVAEPPSGAHEATARPEAFALGEDGVTPAAISLNWTASTAAEFDNYTVLYSNTSASGPWRFVTAIASETTTSVGVGDLGPGLTYWWNVTAYSTNLVILGTTAAYSTILQATQPTLAWVTSPAHTTDSINLSWTNNASYGGVLSFGSYRVVEIDNGVSTTYANLTAVTDNQTTVQPLTTGRSYWFYVDTYDACAACVPSGDSVTESNVVHTGTATALVGAVTATRTTVDAHQLVGFTCTPSGGTPPYTFGWNFTGGDINFTAGSGTTSQAFDRANATGYIVFCQITDHADTSTVPPAVTIVVNRDLRIAATASPLNVTVGSSVAFSCEASRGTAPLSMEWTLGDGAVIPGFGDDANGSASYPSNGTYVAHCSVLDGAGVRATASVLIQVSARAPYAWLTPGVVLGLGSAVGALVAVGMGVTRRRDDLSDQSSAMARWIPPTGPATTVRGAKICPQCGASNVPLRGTCQACGAALPRSPFG